MKTRRFDGEIPRESACRSDVARPTPPRAKATAARIGLRAVKERPESGSGAVASILSPNSVPGGLVLQVIVGEKSVRGVHNLYATGFFGR